MNDLNVKNDELDIIQTLKNRLVPHGTLPVVRLFLDNATYFDNEFISACISEFERIPMQMALDQPISALQQLALHVLMDSAYLKKS